MNEQYYAILGLDKAVKYTYEELKTAYRKMAMKYHPDRNKDLDAVTKFQEVKKAFDVLSAEIKNNETMNFFDIASYKPNHIYNEYDYSKVAIALFLKDELDRLSREIEFWTLLQKSWEKVMMELSFKNM